MLQAAPEKIALPRLYAIVDVGCFRDARDLTGNVLRFAEELASGGVTLLQYRNKAGSAPELLSHARELRRVLGSRVRLIMNDRADLCVAAGLDGVHLGQDDLSPSGARKVIGERLWLGVSTHNPEQLASADRDPAKPDYVAIGPVFATKSKQNPDPVIGLDGVSRARAATTRPLVAIGGITRANCHSVMEAGADAVAVIADLLGNPRKSAEEFRRILR
jgi:thiamine-phosphate pyrophosphorylase